MDSNQIQPSKIPTTAKKGKYPSDPYLLDKLCDRVYELFLLDMRSQRERVRNYGQNRW